MPNLSSLRQSKKAQRQSLTSKSIDIAEESIREQLFNLPAFKQATHIASYMAINNEVPTSSIMLQAHKMGKHLYLPVVETNDQLRFIRHIPGEPLTKSPLGIPEPTGHESIAPGALSLVLVPGVVFSVQGHRMGYGKGHYDRTFAFIKDSDLTVKQKNTPLLMGLAYECQLAPAWPQKPHDINMNFVLTEKTIY